MKTLIICVRKLSVLARIAPFIIIDKKRNMKDFIESQFSCCSLIWMLHSRGLNNKPYSLKSFKNHVQ